MVKGLSNAEQRKATGQKSKSAPQESYAGRGPADLRQNSAAPVAHCK